MGEDAANKIVLGPMILHVLPYSLIYVIDGTVYNPKIVKFKSFNFFPKIKFAAISNPP